jgi:putative methyltransferase (TIGR04325 family)
MAFEAVVARLRQARLDRQSPPAYAGCFDSFAAAAVGDPAAGFGEESYTAMLRRLTEDKLARIDDAFPDVGGRWSHLPLIAATMPGDLRILDFGGSTGFEYAHLKACLKEGAGRIRYHVVDFPPIIAIGGECWAGNDNIGFSSDLPQDERFDIVHCSGSIQYIEDWQATLRRLAGYGPKYINMARTAVHEGRTFVRVQINLKRRFPAWVFNFDELVKVMASIGYDLILGAKSGDLCNASNFPGELQVDWLTNLLFARR